MKRLLLFHFTLFLVGNVNAQTYKVLADSALHTMWAAKDTVGQRKALVLYEQAFKQYPNDIDNLGLYKASVLAGYLMELDKAFKYIEPVAKSGVKKSKGWQFIVGKYSKSEYANLQNDPRWLELVKEANVEKAAFYKKLADNESDFKQGGLKVFSLENTGDGKKLYEKIKNANVFAPKHYQNYSVKFKVTDSLSTAYFVSLPKNYNPAKKYALMFFLHGAVQNNAFAEYLDDSILEDWNRYYTKYAQKQDVIMVYLQGSRKYNWMAPDDGFFMIPAVLKEIKQSINIDDNKVFITGHSNGATGSFSYLMKQQSPFSAFYGFNTQPKVRTGGTFIKNIKNRSYFNVSTDEDYYFPPDANDTLNVLMKKMGADYQDHRFNGFPHWFPQFDESEPVYVKLFADLLKRNRNPFYPEIYWECDDVKYGTIDWISISALDTASRPSTWHETLNFNIHKLLAYDKTDNLVAKDTLLKAFSFPRKSGAIKGYYRNNEFHLQTSAVSAINVFISPEMVNMNKPVIVYVNGVKKITRKPNYDSEFILGNYNSNFDRKAVWVDKIEVRL